MSDAQRLSPCLVVINEEEQYSIWPADRALPLGWARAGFEGSRQACLEEIDRRWKDMRPRSVRVAMEAGAARAGGPE